MKKQQFRQMTVHTSNPSTNFITNISCKTEVEFLNYILNKALEEQDLSLRWLKDDIDDRYVPVARTLVGPFLTLKKCQRAAKKKGKMVIQKKGYQNHYNAKNRHITDQRSNNQQMKKSRLQFNNDKKNKTKSATHTTTPKTANNEITTKFIQDWDEAWNPKSYAIELYEKAFPNLRNK